jgi:hypothetical protein
MPSPLLLRRRAQLFFGMIFCAALCSTVHAQSSTVCYTEPARRASPVHIEKTSARDIDVRNDILMLALEDRITDGLTAKHENGKHRNPKTAPPSSKDSAISFSSSKDTSEYIPWSEYKWADDQMYTLTGNPPRRVTEIQIAPAMAYLGVYFGVLVALHYYQEVTFWSATQSFRIRDNWDESLSANYFGHAIAGYYISYVSTQAFIASGISYKLAPVYGALTGLGYQVYVEVLDGFGSDFSLSPYEMYANVLGVTYFTLSQYIPSLQNWTPKYSYWPSTWYGQLPKAASQTPIDDYSAWNFWVSGNINNITNGSLKPFWPSWLNVAVGYGARNLGYPDESRLITLSLDYDLVKLLPDGSNSWNWFKQTLNFVKLPSPTIEWRFTRLWKSARPARFYLLYPFPINLGSLKF